MLLLKSLGRPKKPGVVFYTVVVGDSKQGAAKKKKIQISKHTNYFFSACGVGILGTHI